MARKTYRRMKANLNEYGDRPLRVSGTHGTDISSTRLDDLDKSMLRDVLESEGDVVADLGSGLGRPAIAAALLGATVYALDILDLVKEYRRIARTMHLKNLYYVQADLSAGLPARPEDVTLCYSQRFIHYLPFSASLTLFKQVRARWPRLRRIYVSASGLNSELGDGYAAAPLLERFAPLAPGMAERHEIKMPVCLYTEDDMRTLAEGAGFTVERVYSSAFGNVKSTWS